MLVVALPEVFVEQPLLPRAVAFAAGAEREGTPVACVSAMSSSHRGLRPAPNNVDFQLHSVVLELERERHASLGYKKKIADMGDMSTKLSLTVSKQQQQIDTNQKALQKVESKWRRKCDALARELHLAQAALMENSDGEKKARKQAKQATRQMAAMEHESAAMRKIPPHDAGAGGAGAGAGGVQMISLQKGLARQRDRSDQLELKLKQTLGALQEEKNARAKSDKLVHELWDKLKEVEVEAKANTTKVAIERQELTKAKQQLQQEVAELKKASTGKQKYAGKGGAARQQAGRELQQVQAKMQQYRDRGEAQRLELAKCTEQLKRESTRAASAEKALAKAISEESRMREAATGGVQQNSKAQTERRNAEVKAEKARAEVQRLHEKNKALNARVAEMEKELGIKAGAEMKQRRFVGVKKAAGYVPKISDDGEEASGVDDDDELDARLAEMAEVEEATGIAAVGGAAEVSDGDDSSDDDDSGAG